MKRTILAFALFIGISASTHATTLTITPDKSIYAVGETISLSVLGDPQGAEDGSIYGKVLFDASVAGYIGSSQDTLTTFGIPWLLGKLSGGPGFAEAFNQLFSGNPFPVDGPLSANVVLVATAPGTLSYSWDTAVDKLRFFGLTSAPGGSVTIVPEPSSALPVASGFFAIALQRKRRRVEALASFAHHLGRDHVQPVGSQIE